MKKLCAFIKKKLCIFIMKKFWFPHNWCSEIHGNNETILPFVPQFFYVSIIMYRICMLNKMYYVLCFFVLFIFLEIT